MKNENILTLSELDKILKVIFKKRKPIPQDVIDEVYSQMTPAIKEYFLNIT